MTKESEYLSGVKKKILFADSDMASYCLLSEFLTGQNIEIIHAICGPDAIRLFSADPGIDCIITEIRIPEIDGFGILSAVRELNPSIPVIAQTACIYDNIKRQCLDSGFNGYLSKPVNMELLLDLVKKYVWYP
ncbi:MAG TPA: response regulator [Bacteroidales bacterium]|nr:response regulator [Bacteroidales bacterium]